MSWGPKGETAMRRAEKGRVPPHNCASCAPAAMKAGARGVPPRGTSGGGWPLIRTNQQRGDEVDEELDYYRDDDDVAVLFTLTDGQQVFVLGNIDYRPEDFAKQIDLKVSCLFLFLPLPVWPLVSCIVLSRPGV